MANYLIILTLFLLCAVTVSIKGNTTVKPDEVKTPEHDQQTKASNVEHATAAASNHTAHVSKDEQHQSTTVPGHEGTHHEQNATKQPHDKKPTDAGQSGTDDTNESEDASVDHGDSTTLNQTMNERYNNTNRPNFRRYIDLRKNIPVVEKRVDNSWVRIRPPMEAQDEHETNITRYAYFPNGSRTSLRSKFDYSYDEVSWFRSSRIKIPISQFANGTTIFQYRFGPKRWIGAFRNRIFRNDTNLSQTDFAPGRTVYHFDQEGSFFHPPAKRNRGDYPYSGNVSYRNKQVYKYGPATEKGAAGTNRRRYGRRYYDRWYNYNNYPPPPPPNQYHDDRRWPQRNRYYDGYYDYRPPYNEPRYPPNDPYYNRPSDGTYYDAHRRYGPAGVPNDPRYGAYGAEQYRYEGDRRYSSGAGYAADGRHASDGAYDSRKYQPDRAYDDQRYHADGAYDDPRNRAYDTRTPDRAPNHEERRYDQGYEDTYDRRRDRRAYGDSYGSYNGSGYDERPPYRGQYQRWDDRPRSQRRRPPSDVNRPHGDSYEEFKWKFAYLDRNRIPEDETKRLKYFTQEYYDILAKTSKNLWKLHRDLRTILPDYERLKEDGIITESNHLVPIVNGSMTLLNNLATKVNARMESNITAEDVIQPIDRGTYSRTLNNFDKMLDILRGFRRPEVSNDFLENFMKNLVEHKKHLFIMYSDITHMVSVLRRTMKRYGVYVMGTGY